MMRQEKILGKLVTITGFRDVRIRDVNGLIGMIREGFRDVHIQIFDARFIAGWEHLYFSAYNALKAFEYGSNISKNVAVEALLFASGQHQISRAVEEVGVKPDSREVAVLIISPDEDGAEKALNMISNFLGGEECDEVLSLNDDKIRLIKKVFNISDLEVEASLRGEDYGRALTNLVIEHVALLSTES